MEIYVAGISNQFADPEGIIKMAHFMNLVGVAPLRNTAGNLLSHPFYWSMVRTTWMFD